MVEGNTFDYFEDDVIEHYGRLGMKWHKHIYRREAKKAGSSNWKAEGDRKAYERALAEKARLSTSVNEMRSLTGESIGRARARRRGKTKDYIKEYGKHSEAMIKEFSKEMAEDAAKAASQQQAAGKSQNGNNGNNGSNGNNGKNGEKPKEPASATAAKNAISSATGLVRTATNLQTENNARKIRKIADDKKLTDKERTEQIEKLKESTDKAKSFNANASQIGQSVTTFTNQAAKTATAVNRVRNAPADDFCTSTRITNGLNKASAVLEVAGTLTALGVTALQIYSNVQNIKGYKKKK